MGLPIKVEEAGVQLLWTPGAIYRGRTAYNSSTLSPLLNKEVNISGSSFIPYITTGKNSLRVGSGYYFQSKFNNEFMIRGYINPTREKQYSVNVRNGDISTGISTGDSANGVIFCVDMVPDDVSGNLYELTGHSYNTSSNIIKRDVSRNTSIFNTSLPIKGGSGRILKVENGEIFVAGMQISDSSHLYLFSNLLVYKINQAGVSTQLYSYDYSKYSGSYYFSPIMPSRLHNGNFYTSYVYYNSRRDLVIDKHNLNEFTTKTIFSIKDHYYYESANWNSVAQDELIITTDENENEFVSFANRYGLGLIPENGYFHCISQNGTIIQKFENISHYIRIDENNFLLGNGVIINKLNWSKSEGKWIILNSFSVGENYKYFALDPTGTIWVHGLSEIHRILPGQGVRLIVEFAEEFYRWNGTQINSSVKLKVVDQNNNLVTTNQTIVFSGPVQFQDGSTVKTVSFSKENEIIIPVIITGPGEINCNLQF